MTTQILSPIDLGATSKVSGRLFRKQILPVGSINYQGRRIEFTRDKLAAMADAFRAGAFDSVPLVMADVDNRHTMDPRATTGEMVDLELTDDGLDGVFRASDEAAALLANYPKVGISARILEGYERADGKTFPVAIQHALITSDPRITGMRPWEAVNLSVEVTETVDLTTESFAADGGQEGVTMTQLSDDETAKLRRLLALVDEQDEAEDTSEDASEEGPELSEDELDALAAEILGESDEQETVGSGEADDQDDEQESGEADAFYDEPIAASNDTAATELANSRVSELEVQLANMQTELDKRNFAAERDRLATEFGIPPAVTELARPLLQGAQTIELANGSSVDAGKVMRDVLTAIGQHVKLLDLSSSVGSAFESDEDKQQDTDRKLWVDQAIESLGLA